MLDKCGRQGRLNPPPCDRPRKLPTILLDPFGFRGGYRSGESQILGKPNHALKYREHGHAADPKERLRPIDGKGFNILLLQPQPGYFFPATPEEIILQQVVQKKPLDPGNQPSAA